MYRKTPQEEALRIPEQYGGTAFSPKKAEMPPRTYTQRKVTSPPGFGIRERLSPLAEERMHQKETPRELPPPEPEMQDAPEEVPLPTEEETERPTAETVSASPSITEGMLGREELLLLVLALIMLGEDGGDSMLGYLLLGMLFLK